MQELPIDAIVPDLLGALDGAPRLVLEAPPGAGKTTRVPWALTRARWCRGQVLVTQPRRIAARLAARRVSEERGVRLGAEVGYRVRFENVSGPATRLLYATEGSLLRQLDEDPLLAAIDCVVLDEVHERSVELDLCLALLERLQRQHRPELRLLAMSATLDADELAAYLHGCQRVRSEGRTFPVEVRHAPGPDDRPLERRVRSAVRDALTREGNVLVFLPGAREIRRCQEALAELALDLEIVPLHGDLPIDQQARAVAPSSQRRVVLATNVAETSVTLPDVTTVIDSGLARVARHSPWSGLAQLELEEISQARAAQRAGRAGRTQAGVALRLYTAGNHAARPRQDLPAIQREDLSGVLLALAARGEARQDALRWLTPPPAGSWQGAVELLEGLGALQDAMLTELGRRMFDFPVHPRLGRLLAEGERRGCSEQACLAAALLSERDVRRETRTRWDRGPTGGGVSGDSDLGDMMDRFLEAQADGLTPRALGRVELDPASCRAVERTYRQFSRLVQEPSTSADPTQLALCLLSAFGDRVAQRRGQGRELLLCGGTTAVLAETSVVHHARWLIALGADSGRGQAVVRIAERIEPEWLLDHYAERMSLEEALTFDAGTERVERISRLRYGKLILDETRQRAEPGPETGELLLKAAQSKGWAVADPEGRLGQLEARLRLLAEQGLLTLAAAELDVQQRGLELGCQQVTTLGELAALDLAALVSSTLPPAVTRALAELTPLRIRLPSGRELSVGYQAGKPPWIQSRLQDFFGMRETPTLCRGRVPLQLHLLAPNQRAVQVTTDLAGFWTRHYPAIRRELMRRYPRHPWPEDGQTAAPPPPRRR